MSKLPQIPGYKITRKLGHGGMADVFLGVQENLEREVAIKVLVPSLFRDQQFSLRFVKEAQTAAKLAHPNIITIHDIGKVENSYYIVMEYLPESLNDRMKKVGILEPKEALAIIKMIAAALDYAHNQGFIHRDIKPDNIMFRPDGTAVLVDFGIARAIDSTTQLTRTGMSIGTPHYMSPEQCRGEKIDGRSDIYSLGVQLFELMTGTVPYKAENTAGIILKHIQDPIPRLPDELKQYQPLIDKMMAKERDTRLQTGTELIKFIDGLVTAQEQELMPTMTIPKTAPVTMPETLTTTVEEATIVTPHPPVESSLSFRKQPKRKKWLLPVILVFVVVIVVGISIYYAIQNPIEKKETTTPITDTEKKEETGKEEEKSEETKIDTTKTETIKTGPIKTGSEKPEDKEVTTPSDVKEEKEETEPPVEKKQAKDQPLKPEQPVKDVKETIKQEKTTKPPEKKKEETPKPIKKEITPPPVKTVSLLGLAPDIRKTYNSRMQRLQFPLLNARFKVMGQIELNLFINENGKVTVLAFKDRLAVNPARHKNRVKNFIGRKINGIYLPPPKNKNGESVKVSNWRVTFKVGKFFNKLILTKQK
jgi:serine/threonine protein kinase